MKKKLIDLYLMYWNEFLTVGAFADYINATGLYSKDELLEDKKVFRYGYKMDWKENITTGLSKELSSRDYLDEDGFNKFFQVIKN